MENEFLIQALQLGLLALTAVFAALALKVVLDVRRDVRELKREANVKTPCKHTKETRKSLGIWVCDACGRVRNNDFV